MSSPASLLTDVDASVRRGSGDDRARIVSRITTLFVERADAFSEEQVAVFDAVIQRFATAIETRARIELAERLAEIPNAPPGVMLTLANDVIVVARPVLSSSKRLDDQALMAIAIEKGRDHMLAICDRSALSACVTDVLVTQGDDLIRHAVVANGGARLSPAGTATLIQQARRHPPLGELLGERSDLSPAEMRQVVEIAKDYARHRLLASLPGSERAISRAVERGASGLEEPLGDPRRYASSEPTRDTFSLSESDLTRLAGEGRLEDTIFVISAMTGLSVACIERIFGEPANDLLIVIGKARGWTWRTVRALLRLRDPALSERHHFRRAEETFDGLASASASRVLHFLKVRETTGHLRDHASSGRSQERMKVR